MDIVIVNVAFEAFAGLGEDIAVARSVDHRRRLDRHAALFRFQYSTCDFAVLDQRRGDPAVQQQFDVGAQH